VFSWPFAILCGSMGLFMLSLDFPEWRNILSVNSERDLETRHLSLVSGFWHYEVHTCPIY
jgi:hypothetical protein